MDKRLIELTSEVVAAHIGLNKSGYPQFARMWKALADLRAFIQERESDVTK